MLIFVTNSTVTQTATLHFLWQNEHCINHFLILITNTRFYQTLNNAIHYQVMSCKKQYMALKYPVHVKHYTQM